MKLLRTLYNRIYLMILLCFKTASFDILNNLEKKKTVFYVFTLLLSRKVKSKFD